MGFCLIGLLGTKHSNSQSFNVLVDPLALLNSSKISSLDMNLLCVSLCQLFICLFWKNFCLFVCCSNCSLAILIYGLFEFCVEFVALASFLSQNGISHLTTPRHPFPSCFLLCRTYNLLYTSIYILCKSL